MTADTRQQLYDRIRETSKDEVILEEMIRHGFWATESEKPSLPEELIKRRGELRREIAELAQRAARYDNQDKALREIMKQRMARAREQRLETKKRQARQRHDKAVAWHEKRRDDIVHLGDTGSKALAGREGNGERLGANGLPAFADMKAIADAMGVPVGELRFLTYNRKVSKVDHYKRFQIPKKTGGMRTVSAPMPRLKRAQYWVLDNILARIEPHDAAHGFRAGRSIVSNAAPHVGKAVVVNLDLKDFFPSISFRRVKGVFASLGYPEAQAAVFALLTTEAPRTTLSLDGETWHVADGERVLPQGAPTSPAITNLLCRKLDRRLQGAARKYGFTYTRYADDLTFSSAADSKPDLDRLMKLVRHVVQDEGLTINDAKTRVMRRGRHQEVTGLTVNDGLGVSRKERRRFRAYLHRAANTAAPSSWRRGSPAASALGYAQFLTMVHGPAVSGLADKARAIFAPRRKAANKPAGALGKTNLRVAAAAGKAPRPDWWTPEAIAPPAVPRELAAETPRTPATPASASASVPSVGQAPDRGEPAQAPPARERPAAVPPVPTRKKSSLMKFVIIAAVIIVVAYMVLR
ncbi:MAG: reverse transcriptase domain-containing protein [Hyphomicrobiaceae bacterium]